MMNFDIIALGDPKQHTGWWLGTRGPEKAHDYQQFLAPVIVIQPHNEAQLCTCYYCIRERETGQAANAQYISSLKR